MRAVDPEMIKRREGHAPSKLPPAYPCCCAGDTQRNNNGKHAGGRPTEGTRALCLMPYATAAFTKIFVSPRQRWNQHNVADARDTDASPRRSVPLQALGTCEGKALPL